MLSAAASGMMGKRSRKLTTWRTTTLPSIVSSSNGVPPHTAASSILTPPTKSKSHHLVLHFDINETLLVGDEAGGATREDCLNTILAKSAFVQMTPIPGCVETNSSHQYTLEETESFVPTHWWNSTPISSPSSGNTTIPADTKPPPLYTGWDWPPNCCPYHRTSYHHLSKTFTHHHGSAYHPIYLELEKRVAFPWNDKQYPTVLSHMLPAFFHTLQTLKERGRVFTLVLRTFGSDLEETVAALNCFANGEHPLYPDFVDSNLMLDKSNMYRGRWKCTTGEDGKEEVIYELHKWTEDNVTVHDSNTGQAFNNLAEASGDEEILRLIESKTVVGIQDDYEFWSRNGWEPWAGKPVWVPRREGSSEIYKHHIMFDDNIHNDPTDSIVAVRYEEKDDDIETSEKDTQSKEQRSTPSSGASKSGGRRFRSLSGEETIQMQGRHLIRVPTLEPILNEDWFLEQIAKAESAVAEDVGA